MKSYLVSKRFLIFVIVLTFISYLNPNVCPTGGPEIYIEVNDDEYVHYKIIAIKDGPAPIYDQNFNATQIYDYAEDVFYVTPRVVLPCEGFDWVSDPNSINDPNNPDLGYGYYLIKIIRITEAQLQEPLIQFYVDLRMHWNRIINTSDIRIKIYRNLDGTFIIQNSFYTQENGEEYRDLENNDIILIWENNYNQTQDFSPF